ncbi:hypothetical protein PCANB_002178 [Pneumocystis canis]|nr:hypothetical protein PCANB_002178 [Pneumocystis canis]
MEQTITGNLERYYEDFLTVLSDIKDFISEFRNCDKKHQKNEYQAIERAIDEANEIVVGQMEIEVLHVPLTLRTQEKKKIQNCHHEIRRIQEEFESLHLQERYIEPFTSNYDSEFFNQRNKLLEGTRRLEQSSEWLKNARRVADETSEIGANILRDLSYQREQIMIAKNTLIEADGYVDKSIRTLKIMAQR